MKEKISLTVSCKYAEYEYGEEKKIVFKELEITDQSDVKKEKDGIGLKMFVDTLKANSIFLSSYHSRYESLNLPEFPSSVDGFYWGLLEDPAFYQTYSEALEKSKKIIKDNPKVFNRVLPSRVRKLLNEFDPMIPPISLEEYYGE